MSFFDHTGPVSYLCTCGKLKPLYRLYFCRHCFELRCGFCVSSEIDTRYCASCNENLHTSEAWMKKHCCSNCFLCPMCESGLTKRMTSVPKHKAGSEGEKPDRAAGDGKPDKTAADGKPDKAAADGKPESGKAYYLLCPFCHWTTRSVGLPDATSASGQWLEIENPDGPRITELVEYFRGVALNDKFNRERKNQGTRRPYTHMSGLSAALVRKRAGLPPNVGSPYKTSEEPLKNIKIEQVVAGPATEDLPDDIYTVAPDLTSMTTIEQSLRIPETEPRKVTDVCFTRKPLMVKRSLRCRICEHNVIKSEFLPNSIKFKIQLSAYYMIPEVLIKAVEPLRAGQSSELLLVIVNPTQYQTSVTFLPLDHEEPKVSAADAVQVKSTVRPLKVNLTGTVDLPKKEIPLPDRDDAAEFDDSMEHQNFNDDPSIVVWRRGNRVAVKMLVRPNEDLSVGSPVVIGFTLRHIYTNTVIQQDKKELNKVNHAFKIIVDAGKSAGC